MPVLTRKTVFAAVKAKLPSNQQRAALSQKLGKRWTHASTEAIAQAIGLQSKPRQSGQSKKAARSTAQRHGVAKSYAADQIAGRLTDDSDRKTAIKQRIVRVVSRELKAHEKQLGRRLTLDEKRKFAVKAIHAEAQAIKAGKPEKRVQKDIYGQQVGGRKKAHQMNLAEYAASRHASKDTIDDILHGDRSSPETQKLLEDHRKALVKAIDNGQTPSGEAFAEHGRAFLKTFYTRTKAAHDLDNGRMVPDSVVKQIGETFPGFAAKYGKKTEEPKAENQKPKAPVETKPDAKPPTDLTAYRDNKRQKIEAAVAKDPNVRHVLAFLARTKPDSDAQLRQRTGLNQEDLLKLTNKVRTDLLGLPATASRQQVRKALKTLSIDPSSKPTASSGGKYDPVADAAVRTRPRPVAPGTLSDKQKQAIAAHLRAVAKGEKQTIPLRALQDSDGQHWLEVKSGKTGNVGAIPIDHSGQQDTSRAIAGEAWQRRQKGMRVVTKIQSPATGGTELADLRKNYHERESFGSESNVFSDVGNMMHLYADTVDTPAKGDARLTSAFQQGQRNWNPALVVEKPKTADELLKQQTGETVDDSYQAIGPISQQIIAAAHGVKDARASSIIVPNDPQQIALAKMLQVPDTKNAVHMAAEDESKYTALSEYGGYRSIYLDTIAPSTGKKQHQGTEEQVNAAAKKLLETNGRNWVPLIVRPTGEKDENGDDRYEVIGNHFAHDVVRKAGIDRAWVMIGDDSVADQSSSAAAKQNIHVDGAGDVHPRGKVSSGPSRKAMEASLEREYGSAAKAMDAKTTTVKAEPSDEEVLKGHGHSSFEVKHRLTQLKKLDANDAGDKAYREALLSPIDASGSTESSLDRTEDQRRLRGKTTFTDDEIRDAGANLRQGMRGTAGSANNRALLEFSTHIYNRLDDEGKDRFAAEAGQAIHDDPLYKEKRFGDMIADIKQRHARLKA